MTRFNKHELVSLACQPSHKFDKEGLLIVYERQDGLFRRHENRIEKEIKEKPRKSRRSTFRNLSCYGGITRVPSERWCRLRGNLLFYFKSQEAWSEPAGVIVLNISKVTRDPVSVDGYYSFTLVMVNSGGDQRLATLSENERNSWVEVLEKSNLSFSLQEVTKLESKVHALRDSSQSEAGKVQNLPVPGELPFLELALSCDNLRCDGHGYPPSPQVLVEVKLSPNNEFIRIGQTEIMKSNSNPVFLVTVPLWQSLGTNEETRIRFQVRDVIEHVTGTAVLIGRTETSLTNLAEENNKLRLSLLSADESVVGFITVTSVHCSSAQLQNRSGSNPQSPQDAEENVTQGHRRTQSLPPRLLTELQPPSQGWLGALFTNAVARTYRFHSGLGGDIAVHESMLESRLNHVIPSQLLRLWINEEKDMVRELAALGELSSSQWHQKMLQLLERHFRRIGDYTQALESVESASSYFRASSQKDKATLQFSPVNLHLQRMWVQNSSLRKSAIFDIVTVGAFTAIPHGFKGGGLLRLLKNFQHNNAQSVDAVRVARQAAQAAAKIFQHLQAAVKLMLSAAEGKNMAAVLKAAETVVKKCQALTSLVEPLNVNDALEFYELHRNHRQDSLNASTTSSCDFSLLPLRSMAQRVANDCSQEQNTGFYSVLDEPEPADLTKINLDASLMTLALKLRELMKKSNGTRPCYAQPGVYLTALLIQLEEKENESNSAAAGSQSEVESHVDVKETCLSRPADLVTKDDNVISDVKKPTVDRGTSRQDGWTAELKPCLSKLLRASLVLLKTIRLVHGIHRLREEPLRAATSHAIQHRRDVCFSQSLTAAITALISRLCCQPPDAEFLLLLSRIGVLYSVEGVLTPYKAEAGMWSDLAVAVEDLASVKFRIVPANSGEQHEFLTAGIPPSFMPRVQGWREEIQVTIPVPSAVFSALPAEAARFGCLEFQLTPVFFNVAINEQAVLANTFGDMSAVTATNQQSLERLLNYHRKFQKVVQERSSARRSGELKFPLAAILEKLQSELNASKIQNVEVLHLSEVAVRLMKGVRITCCKSAKDRTGMAVTLEQGLVLRDEFDLAHNEFQRAVDAFRSEGTRRKNTEKNVGAAKYAFTQLQLMSFPTMYKPPAGTYGNVQS